MSAGFKFVSADSHVVEPPDLWVQRIDRRYTDSAPHLLRENGIDYFITPGATVEKMSIGFTSAALTDADKISADEVWENIYPGAYDPHARIDALERDNVEAEVIYTSLGLRMFSLQDPNFQSACFRAFNDWLANFCEAHPKQYFGAAMIPTDLDERARDEMRRASGKGLKAAMISVLPEDGYHDPKYDPIWATSVELGLPISLHLAGSKKSFAYSGNSLVDFSLGFTLAMYSVATMIFSGVFDRHRGLKVATVENDAGWAAIMLERMDYRYERDRFWASHANGITSGRVPSQQFHDHVYCTFMRDHTAVRNRDYIGLKNIMWGSDFPHQDSTWPNSLSVLEAHFADVPEDDQRRIARCNAIELYNLPLTP